MRHDEATVEVNVRKDSQDFQNYIHYYCGCLLLRGVHQAGKSHVGLELHIEDAELDTISCNNPQDQNDSTCSENG